MNHLPPRVDPPSVAELRDLAERFSLEMDEEALRAEQELIASRMGALERLDALPDRRQSTVQRHRDPGYRPGDDEDPTRAWLRRCRVEGAADGLLADVTVGVKDNVAVAGVPMTCSAKPLEGYVPLQDAFVVEQVLEAGATITGKTNMDEMAVSGSGEITLRGPVANPHDPAYLAGGSSGGSAVAVATGDVDVAIGTDQAGSIRVPAAWCGCVGLKPTHGLLSYSGCVPLGHSFDHVGPMARTVDETAELLTAMAGRDPGDPRQARREPRTYGPSGTDPSDLVIGRLEEGFTSEHAEQAVNDRVDHALEELESEGATVRELSVPFHNDALAIALAIQVEEIAALWQSEGTGYFVGGEYNTHYAGTFAQARRGGARGFSPTVEHVFLLGGYLAEQLQSRYHGKAANLRLSLEEAYDEALAEVDVLAMPTTPTTAFERVEVDSRVELVNRAQGKAGRTRNTMPFNITGHPGISVPVGTADRLPVGLSFVGSPFEESTLLQAARAVEAATAYDTSPISLDG